MFGQRFILGVSRDVWDEINWAQEEQHEDSLAMESVEEQDLAEEVLRPRE